MEPDTDNSATMAVHFAVLCKDCANHYKHYLHVDHDTYIDRCKLKVMDPISGALWQPGCTVARLNESMCGRRGEYWKPK